MKKKMTTVIKSQEMLTGGIFKTVLALPKGAVDEVTPGQFIGVYPRDASMLLPRPISICRWDPEAETLTIVYRTVGRGTGELAMREVGESVDILGILGNGYPLDDFAGKRALLFGGGVGVPPMLELAARLRGVASSVTVANGYRTGKNPGDLFLREEFLKVADEVLTATDDGSAGVHGTCLDAAKKAMEGGASFDIIAACGPLPMLRGVKNFAADIGIPAYISLEERMACGVGVCLGCVTKTTETDLHSHVKNARVCTDGPVFPAERVDI